MQGIASSRHSHETRRRTTGIGSQGVLDRTPSHRPTEQRLYGYMDRLSLHRLLPIGQHPDDRLDNPTSPAMPRRNASTHSARLCPSPTRRDRRPFEQHFQGSNRVGEHLDKGHFAGHKGAGVNQAPRAIGARKLQQSARTKSTRL